MFDPKFSFFSIGTTKDLSNLTKVLTFRIKIVPTHIIPTIYILHCEVHNLYFVCTETHETNLYLSILFKVSLLPCLGIDVLIFYSAKFFFDLQK